MIRLVGVKSGLGWIIEPENHTPAGIVDSVQSTVPDQQSAARSGWHQVCQYWCGCIVIRRWWYRGGLSYMIKVRRFTAGLLVLYLSGYTSLPKQAEP